jgi:hypothetical protein
MARERPTETIPNDQGTDRLPDPPANVYQGGAAQPTAAGEAPERQGRTTQEGAAEQDRPMGNDRADKRQRVDPDDVGSR